MPAPSAIPPQNIGVAALETLFQTGTPLIGVIGLGYVGLPLIRTFAAKQIQSLGFDIDQKRVAALNAGQSPIKNFLNTELIDFLKHNLFEATTDFSRIKSVDAILICVPTPLGQHREPDLSYVEATARHIAPYLRAGQLIVLESTTYPGTTYDLMRPLLEEFGLVSGRDLFIAYSPEREDPGNQTHHTAIIPKVIGADDADALRLATALYDRIVARTIPVSSTHTAEAVKLTENIFRAVNIALVNELKLIFEPMDINVWEVIEAAKSKPFGYMPFYPGPGLGGHCIPIDPFYLTWKAREYGTSTRFIELAGEINTSMPHHVVNRLVTALSDHQNKPIKDARILLMGVAYKKNVDDQRESPGLVLIDLIEARGAHVDYYDPHVPELHYSREHAHLGGRRSVEFSARQIAEYDAILICTNHDQVDYALLAKHSRLILDTRNAMNQITKDQAIIIRA